MFYTYDQNNSGGVFDVNEWVTKFVIVEADNAADADKRAQDIVGIYFNGVDDGIDCPCCGDRWYSTYRKGDDAPMIYGKPPEEYVDNWTEAGKPYCIIYYKNGEVVRHRA
jgi:hypothetical protein